MVHLSFAGPEWPGTRCCWCCAHPTWWCGERGGDCSFGCECGSNDKSWQEDHILKTTTSKKNRMGERCSLEGRSMEPANILACRVIFGELGLRITNWRESFLRMCQKLFESGMLQEQRLLLLLIRLFYSFFSSLMCFWPFMLTLIHFSAFK